jgi:hypothetical protein
MSRTPGGESAAVYRLGSSVRSPVFQRCRDVRFEVMCCQALSVPRKLNRRLNFLNIETMAIKSSTVHTTEGGMNQSIWDVSRVECRSTCNCEYFSLAFPLNHFVLAGNRPPQVVPVPCMALTARRQCTGRVTLLEPGAKRLLDGLVVKSVGHVAEGNIATWKLLWSVIW